MYYITSKANKLTGTMTLIGERQNRGEARAFAKANAGTVRTQAEYSNLIADGRLPRTPVAAEPQTEKEALGNMFTEIAEQVNASAKVAETVGRKEKAMKRKPTPEHVLQAAITSVMSNQASTGKVSLVRALAAFEHDGHKLQRRDVMALLAKTDVAMATISTQWQLVRSGKITVDADGEIIK